MKDKRIAVIGAGPMGLAVAYQLVKEGYKPVVFEADDRIGGMTAVFDFAGVEIERYYHFHCTSDDAFFEVLKELSLEDKLHWVSTKMGYWFNNELQSWGNPVALLKFRGLGLIAKFRYGLHAFLSVKRNNWRPLEKYDARTWIKRWVGKEAFDILWDKLFSLKFYEHSGNLSAPWIWSRIRRIGRSRYSLFKEKLGYIEGGSKTLLNAMKAYIEENGGVFKLSTPVQEVVTENECLKGVVANGELIQFDEVVSTVPMPIFGKMLKGMPDEVVAKYTDRINIGVVCVISKLSKQLTENFWLNTNDDEMDIPGIVEYGNLNPESGHIVYIPYYMPQDNPKYSDNDDVFREKAKRYFMKINKDLSESDIEAISVHRYFHAQPICQPGYLETLPYVSVCKGLRAADTSYYYPEDRGISESIDFGRAIARNIKAKQDNQ